MALAIIGQHPLARDERHQPPCRIATIFLPTRTLVTLPGIHATQRQAYTDRLNEQRRRQNLAPLTNEEEFEVWSNAVDLVIDAPHILIRPDPAHMELALEADSLLQTMAGVSKQNIRFLFVQDKRVHQAIRQRGEYWRIASPPRSSAEIGAMIQHARMAVRGTPLYYYSAVDGTRYMTLQQYRSIADMDDRNFLLHMREIAEHSKKHNRFGRSELAFFGAEKLHSDLLAAFDWERADAREARVLHQTFGKMFRDATPPALHQDRPDNLVWRNRMFSCLSGRHDPTTSEHVLHDLNPEFYRQIQWLPGASIDEHGELVFDPILSRNESAPCPLRDRRVQGFIINYVREFGNLEYVNIGHINPGMSRYPATGAHRVYIAEVKHRGSPTPVIRILRLQKWGIHEHLKEGKDLLQAILQTEEYTDYILDRRLGCWQLGMPLPSRMFSRRIAETYSGPVARHCGTRIWTSYFERDYIRGVATDKIPEGPYRKAPYALALARLLGQTAAPNLIVGRTRPDGNALFDDGDEIMALDRNGMPRRILVADHAGTFGDCESPLTRFARSYASPVLSRQDKVPDAAAFAEAYLSSLEERLGQIQQKYRKHRHAFDSLFKHSKQDVGAFSWRWRKVLTRLDLTHVPELVAAIRAQCGP